MTITHTLVGNGPIRVITVHGWFGAADGWGLLPELVDTDAYSVAFFDLRGYGARADEDGGFTLDEVADDVFALADELGWERFALLGHSMGGAMVLRAWSRHPDRITAVVGLTPVPASGVPFDTDQKALFEGAASEDANRAAIIDFTTGNRQPTSWVKGMVDFSRTHSHPEAVAGYLASWSSADFVDELPTPRVPVHVIAGQHDLALGPDTMRATWLAQIPGAEMTVLENSGHYPMFEAPVSLVGALEQALSEVSGQDG